MHSKYFSILALIGVLLACPLYAQMEEAPPAVVTTEIETEDADDENAEAPEVAAEAESTDDVEDDEAPEIEDIAIDLDDPDDIDLDDQSYEEDDDDFVPTQEIPANTPIAFPSNI